MNGQPGSGAACPKEPHPLCHSEASLLARNLLAASSEASRDQAALQNDNSLGIFRITPLRKTRKPFLQRGKTEDEQSQKQRRVTIFYAIAYENLVICN